MAKRRASKKSGLSSMRVMSFKDVEGLRRVWNAVVAKFLSKKPELDTVIWVVDSAFGKFQVIPVRSTAPQSDDLPSGPRESISFWVNGYDPDRFIHRLSALTPGKKLDQAIKQENARIAKLVSRAVEASFRQLTTVPNSKFAKLATKLGVYVATHGSLSTAADCKWLSGVPTLENARRNRSDAERLRVFATRHEYDPTDLFATKRGKLEAICLLTQGRRISDSFLREFETLADVFTRHPPKYVRILRDPTLGPLNLKVSDAQIERLLKVVPSAKVDRWNESRLERYYKDVQAKFIAGIDQEWLAD
jgi:hypothetical protein